MNKACPICRKTTEIDSSVGDFLTRCDHCGNLLRFPDPKKVLKPTLERSPRASVSVAAVLPSKRATQVSETEIDVQRIRQRHAAVTRAMRKGKQEAMGTLGWIGVGVAVVLAVILVSSRAQTLISHSAGATDTLVMR